MKKLFFLLLLFVPFVVHAQRYPYDKNDVDTFVIDDPFAEEEYIFSTPDPEVEEETTTSTSETTESEEEDSSAGSNDTLSSNSTDDSNTTEENNSSDSESSNNDDDSSNSSNTSDDSSSSQEEESSSNQNSNDSNTDDSSSDSEGNTSEDSITSSDNEAETTSSEDTTETNTGSILTNQASSEETSETNETASQSETSDDTTTNSDSNEEEDKGGLLDALFNLVGGTSGTDIDDDTTPVNTIVSVSVSEQVTETLQNTPQIVESFTVSEIVTSDDLALFIQNQVIADSRIDEVVVTERRIQTQYRQPGRVFGFFPIRYTQSVVVTFQSNATLDTVTIQKPWWTMFVSGDNTRRLEIEIQKEVEEILASGGDVSDEDLEGLLQRLGSLFSKIIELLQGFSRGAFG